MRYELYQKLHGSKGAKAAALMSQVVRKIQKKADRYKGRHSPVQDQPGTEQG